MDRSLSWKDVSCKMQAGSRMVATGPSISAQGLGKEFPRGLHKKSFQKCSIKHPWRKTVRRRLSLALFCLAQVFFHTQKHMYRLRAPYNASLKASSAGYNCIQDQQGLFPQAILCVWEAFALNFTVSQSTNRCCAVKHKLFKGNLHDNFTDWQAILNSS